MFSMSSGFILAIISADILAISGVTFIPVAAPWLLSMAAMDSGSIDFIISAACFIISGFFCIASAAFFIASGSPSAG
eukprot:CAMPEP_0113699646 /NCGR_PEP_ID=MMETSP0038_2-20120614/23455_1 /TAXON_ID=2898 /ORGANISM="Cryptomonas paramecium" /LENGTH=76 /DNA_ID=CAMNT_0000623091 /DNA_START=42 /DNA_END=268 /DNA_ORIENTATION=+ /assembly_acc=CAM_ASM_000170